MKLADLIAQELHAHEVVLSNDVFDAHLHLLDGLRVQVLVTDHVLQVHLVLDVQWLVVVVSVHSEVEVEAFSFTA